MKFCRLFVFFFFLLLFFFFFVVKELSSVFPFGNVYANSRLPLDSDQTALRNNVCNLLAFLLVFVFIFANTPGICTYN